MGPSMPNEERFWAWVFAMDPRLQVHKLHESLDEFIAKPTPPAPDTEPEPPQQPKGQP
ncbi:hypothetical protein D9M73_78760 [compost metagenome]